jgi:hypothetical protein
MPKCRPARSIAGMDSQRTTEAYTLCSEALHKNRHKLRVPTGKTAVLYAGKSASGEVWKTLEARQRDHLKRLGVEAPYLMLPDVLEHIPVRIAGKTWTLCDAMFNHHLFVKDESRRLWEEASRLWALGNDKVFLWRGTGVGDNANPIFDDIELPIQMLRNSKLNRFNERQIATALERIRQRRPLEAELLVAEREFNELAHALAQRDRTLRRFGFRDTHPALAKLSH